MGCFSFMCKECEKPILSTSFSGQEVKLFLLNKGEVIQEMEGQYDSYGRVFIEGTQDESVRHDLKKSVQWEDPFPDVPPSKHDQYFIDKDDDHWKWSRVCDLMFTEDDDTGIAAVHSKCFKEVPTTDSNSDPNQGWGEDGELFDDFDPDLVIE